MPASLLTLLRSYVTNAQDIYVDGNRIGEIWKQVSSKIAVIYRKTVSFWQRNCWLKFRWFCCLVQTSSRVSLSTWESGTDSPKPRYPLMQSVSHWKQDVSANLVNESIVNAIRPFLYENTERGTDYHPDDPHQMKNSRTALTELFFLCFLWDWNPIKSKSD